jgi:predicted CopG family antitoxin
MSKFFKYDLINNTIIASATNIKKAGDPTSPQYKELCAMKKAQPSFSVAVKEIAKSKKKQTYSGLTMEAMRVFVEGRKNEVAMAEFNRLCAEASYPIVKSWFLSNYKDAYKKTENKQAMTKAKIVKITSKTAAPVLSKVG